MAMTTLIAPGSAQAVHTATELTLRVEQADTVADGVRRLVLRDPDGRRLPDWAPGAHVDVHLPDGLVRQYSLCGDRWDAYSFQIAVLREPASRGGSAYIHDQLRAGDTIGVGGPRNNFAMAPAPSYLFIAGGIGITPILPMIRQAEILDLGWSLLYGGRCQDSMAFLGDLACHGDRVTCWPQDVKGLLPLEKAFAELPAGAKVYSCGPAPLLAAVERFGADLPAGTVRIERFVAETLPPPARTTPFQVDLQQSGRSVTVAPGQSVLEAIAAAGVPVLSSCGRGLCGTCETKVIDGVVDHRDSLLSDDERTRGTSMLPCVSRACSDRLVLDI